MDHPMPRGEQGRTPYGFTVAELLVATVLGLLIVGAFVPLAVGGRRANDRQKAIRGLQGDLHTVSDYLVRAVRNADSVHADSDADRLIIEGSPEAAGCGVVDPDDALWIQRLDEELRCGPYDGSALTGRTLAGGVSVARFRYGLDPDSSGTVPGDPATFSTGFTPAEAGDVVAVAFELETVSSSARMQHEVDIRFLAVLRRRILERVTLAGS